MSRTLSIVADIGGTNTRVAMAEGAMIDRASIRRFANADYPGLDAVLTTYLADAGQPGCAGACAAVAGPVQDGVATLTNLDWTIDQSGIAAATGAGRVAVINDLQAQGYGLDHLAKGSLRPVITTAQTPNHPATRLVIGVGTGFNAAPVHGTASGRIVPGSECGHVSLPVRTAADLRLAQFVEKVHGFAGVEDVLSGRGLERLHGWLAAEAGQDTHRTAADILASIAAGNDPLATDTGRTFARLLGAVAGDLALIHLPFGGIYLIGGVARAFAPYLEPFGFAEAFRDKGRFSGFMRAFPVHVIEDDFAALAGCAAYLDGGF